MWYSQVKKFFFFYLHWFLKDNKLLFSILQHKYKERILNCKCDIFKDLFWLDNNQNHKANFKGSEAGHFMYQDALMSRPDCTQHMIYSSLGLPEPSWCPTSTITEKPIAPAEYVPIWTAWTCTCCQSPACLCWKWLLENWVLLYLYWF